MNYLERNSESIKNVNLALSTILIAGVLGMSGYLLQDFRSTQKDVEGVETTVLSLGGQISYEGDQYKTYASILSIIVISAVCLGINLSKTNNEYIGSPYLEKGTMLIIPLIALVLFILAFMPTEDTTVAVADPAVDESTRQASAYDIAAVSLLSIFVGILTHHNEIFKSNHILGTSLFLVLTVVVLGLLAYMYILLVSDNDKESYNAADTDGLRRKLDDSEKNLLLASLVFAAVIVSGGVFHMVMERKYLTGMFGSRKSPERKTSPKRKSPKRKTSPKRKSPVRK